MFERIAQFFSKGWGIFTDWIAGCWETVKAWTTSIWAVVLLAAGWVYSLLEWLNDKVESVISWVDGFLFPDVVLGGSGTFTYYFNVANTVAPIEELFRYIIAYFALLISLNIYRLVKSWIPTVSG